MLAIVLCAAVLMGVVVSRGRPVDPGVAILALALSALALLLAWRTPSARTATAFVCAFVVGVARLAFWPPATSDDLVPLVGRPVSLAGTVSGPPQVSAAGTTVTLRLSVTFADFAPSTSAPVPVVTPRSGLVQLVAPRASEAGRVQVGDTITATGRLALPDTRSGIDFAASLRRAGIFTEMVYPRVTFDEAGALGPATALGRLRSFIQSGFSRALPQPQAALASGVLLGGSAGLSAEFRSELQASGLGHLVAIDGYKLVVIVGALGALAVRLLGRRASLPVVLLGILLYAGLAGFPASAVRAGLMLGLGWIAGSVGRIADPLTAVVLAVTLMVLAQPGQLDEPGFQLSVSATLGLILLSGPLRERLRILRLPAWAAESLALTVAVTLATLPVTLAVFRQVSLVSPLAHLFVIPLVPAILAADALLAISLPIPPLASFVAWLVWLPTTALAEVVRVSAAVPTASIFTGRAPTPVLTILAACLLVCGGWGLPEIAPVRFYLASVRSSWSASMGALGAARGVLLVSIAAVAVMALAYAAHGSVQPDGRLHVDILDSGNGSATLVRGPDGTTVLVGGPGVDPVGLANLVSDHLGLWERGLGTVVALDPADDLAVSETVRRYPPAHGLVRRDALVDLGDGATLSVTTGAAALPTEIAVGYQDLWLRVSGEGVPLSTVAALDGDEPVVVLLNSAAWPSTAIVPFLDVIRPNTRSGPAQPTARASYLVPAPREGSVELVSDGTGVWSPDDDLIPQSS